MKTFRRRRPILISAPPVELLEPIIGEEPRELPLVPGRIDHRVQRRGGRDSGNHSQLVYIIGSALAGESLYLNAVGAGAREPPNQTRVCGKSGKIQRLIVE